MIDIEKIRQRCIQADCESCPFYEEDTDDVIPFAVDCLLKDIVAEDEE